jgi:hypothetical protein
MVRPACRSLGEHVSGTTIVSNVKDRYAGGPAALERRGDALDDLRAVTLNIRCWTSTTTSAVGMASVPSRSFGSSQRLPRA